MFVSESLGVIGRAEERLIWDLSPHWDHLADLARQRDRQKEFYASTQALRKDQLWQLCGLLGEKAYSLWRGLPLNESLLAEGDGGNDFPDGTDVKAVSNSNPDLKHPLNPKFWPRERFVLVFVVLQTKRARIMGWVPWQELKRAPCKTYREDAGPQHFLNWRALRPMPRTVFP
jgi:hypothetical protein